MKLTSISNDVNEWFNGSGPISDIVISSRIRLARNLSGYKFLSSCSSQEKARIVDTLRDALSTLKIGDKIQYVDIDSSSDLEKNFLIERHLISRHHAFASGPRGAVIAQREFFTAMINEEDHLRIQVLKGGSQLKECFSIINKADNDLEKKLDYAFSSKYGYLTACPTNLGTGIRVSVMLHLPALKMTGQIEKFFNAAKSMNLAVRGLFGEGTQSTGDFFQLSNQITLGVSEEDIITDFDNLIIPEIVEYEKAARKELLVHQRNTLDDKISRAIALLKSAQLISSQESLFLLSHLRLGINMHEFMNASTPAIEQLCELTGSSGEAGRCFIKTINRLFMLTLPAHLQINKGRELSAGERDALRAQIIRQSLTDGK